MPSPLVNSLCWRGFRTLSCGKKRLAVQYDDIRHKPGRARTPHLSANRLSLKASCARGEYQRSWSIWGSTIAVVVPI